MMSPLGSFISLIMLIVIVLIYGSMMITSRYVSKVYRWMYGLASFSLALLLIYMAYRIWPAVIAMPT